MPRTITQTTGTSGLKSSASTVTIGMEKHYAVPPQEAPGLTYQVEASCRIYQAEEWLRLWETEGFNYRYQALESLDQAIKVLRESYAFHRPASRIPPWKDGFHHGPTIPASPDRESYLG